MLEKCRQGAADAQIVPLINELYLVSKRRGESGRLRFENACNDVLAMVEKHNKALRLSLISGGVVENILQCGGPFRPEYNC